MTLDLSNIEFVFVQAVDIDQKQKADDYDIVVQEMAFEVKAQVNPFYIIFVKKMISLT